MRIFISSTSGDLASTRQTVAGLLAIEHHEVVEEQGFPFTGETLVEKMEGCLKKADVVLHLVGTRWGGDSGVQGSRWGIADASVVPLSYTQLEAVQAARMKMPIVAVVLGENFPATSAPAEPDQFVQRQTAYRKGLLDSKIERGICLNQKELDEVVRKIEWDRLLYSGFQVEKYQQTIRAKYSEVSLSAIVGDSMVGPNYLAGLDRIFIPPEIENCDKEVTDLMNGFHSHPSEERTRNPSDSLDPSREEQRRLVFLGDAGSGKSTFLKWQALRWAHLPLNEAAESALPVLVHLGEFAASLDFQGGVGSSLIDFAAKRLFSEQGETINPKEHSGLLTWLLREGKAWLLLDALDEIYSSDKRAAMAETIASLVRQISSCAIWLSTREAGYLDSRCTALRIFTAPAGFGAQATFTHWRLMPFSEEQVSHFLQKWFAARLPVGGAKQQAANDARELEEFFGGNPKVADLARVPLLLTLLAILHKRRGDLPATRYDIYSECADLFFERWLRPGYNEKKADFITENHILDDINLNKKILRILLWRVAWQMQNTEEQNNIIRRDVLSQFLEKGIDIICKPKYEGQNAEAAKEVCRLFIERAFILASNGDTVSFIHRGFLEFFAAEVVLASIKGEIYPELPGKMGLKQYRDTVLWRERKNYYLVQSDPLGRSEDPENPLFASEPFKGDGRVDPHLHWELDPSWREIKLLSFSRLPCLEAEKVLRMLLQSRWRRPKMWTIYLAASLLAETSETVQTTQEARKCKEALLDSLIGKKQSVWMMRGALILIPVLVMALGLAIPAWLFTYIGWWTVLVFPPSLAAALVTILSLFMFIERGGFGRYRSEIAPSYFSYEETLLDRLDWINDQDILNGLVYRSRSSLYTTGASVRKLGSNIVSTEKLMDVGLMTRTGNIGAISFLKRALNEWRETPSQGERRRKLLDQIGSEAGKRGSAIGRNALILLLLEEEKLDNGGDVEKASREIIKRYPRILPFLMALAKSTPSGISNF